MEDRKCPLCREKIPPTKEMVTQLKCWRKRKSDMGAEGDIYSENYKIAKSEIERLERAIGDCTETIDYSDNDKNYLALPTGIYEVARTQMIYKKCSIGSDLLQLTNSGLTQRIRIVWMLHCY